MMFVDKPLARWIAGRATGVAFWNRGIAVLELVSGLTLSNFTVGVIAVAGMAVTAAVRRWRAYMPAWAFVAAVHLISWIAMGWLKTATARLRPRVWLTVGGAMFFRAGGASFPSGHVVHFASVIVPLVIVWPRVGRPLLVVVAFVMMARVAVLQHFASDVFGALALVAIVAWLCAAAIRPLRPRVSGA